MSIDPRLYKLWRTTLTREAREQPASWLLDWLQSGFQRTMDVGAAAISYESDRPAFWPFEAEITEPRTIESLLQDLLRLVGNDQVTLGAFRRALARLPTRYAFGEEARNDVVILPVFRVLSGLEITETLGELRAQKLDEIFTASDRVVHALLRMCRRLGTEGAHFIEAIRDLHIPHWQALKRHRFVYVLAQAEIHLCPENDPGAREPFVLHVLERYRPSLQACGFADEAQVQLTREVVRGLSTRISATCFESLFALAKHDFPILTTEILVGAYPDHMRSVQKRDWERMTSRVVPRRSQTPAQPRVISAMHPG